MTVKYEYCIKISTLNISETLDLTTKNWKNWVEATWRVISVAADIISPFKSQQNHITNSNIRKHCLRLILWDPSLTDGCTLLAGHTDVTLVILVREPILEDID